MGHVAVENFGQGLVEHHRVHVEARPVEVEPVDVNAVLGWLGEARLLQRHKVIDEQIDRDGVLARVVLPGARQECLREIEAG